MMADHWLLLIIILGMLTLLIGADANLIPIVTITEGNTVRLECRTTVRSLVDWKKEIDPKAPGDFIVSNGRLVNKYKSRFEFDNDTYTLTIHNVTVNDSHLYYCFEDKGFGQQHFVQLSVDVDECASSPCENDGICINEVNSFQCNCTDGFTGVNCQFRIKSADVDECASSPCQNDGMCIDEVNSYQCSCTAEFTGVNCQIRIPVLPIGGIVGICAVIIFIIIVIVVIIAFLRARFLCTRGNSAKCSWNKRTNDEFQPLMSNNVKYVNSIKIADTSDFPSKGKSQVFDDGELCSKDPLIYVTGMTICIRRWKTTDVVGGLKIQYSCGKVTHGSLARCGNKLHQFKLEKDEKIVKVIVRSGWLIDSMTFYTDKGNQFGPYGGHGGHECTLEYPHCDDADHKSYLAYIKGCIDTAEDKPVLRSLQLVWGCLELQGACPLFPVRQLETKKHHVVGMTQFDKKIFVLCQGLNRINVFGLDYKKLEDIRVEGLIEPNEIAACTDTRLLYIADKSSKGYVWRVSENGQISKFEPKPETFFIPASVSVRSRRLLVTTNDNEMFLYGADGAEQKRLPFKDMPFRHAMETTHDTFVLCCIEPRVVEVSGAGEIIHEYQHDEQHLEYPCHMSFFYEGNLFIADLRKRHVLLLTSDLKFDRVLLDNEHNRLAEKPHRLLYVPQTRQLIVSNWSDSNAVIQVFAIDEITV